MKILCIDDSILRRAMLSNALRDFELAHVGPDPREVFERLESFRPDLVTLDLDAGRGVALATLEVLMKRHPVRTLVVGALATREAVMALRACELGAVDMLARPLVEASSMLEAARAEVIARVRRAGRVKMLDRRAPAAIAVPCPHGSLRPAPLPGPAGHVLALVGGAGAPEALKEVLPKLSAHVPATLVVPHLPSAYARVLGEALQKLCRFEVKEIEDGDFLLPGRALIVPDGFGGEVFADGAHLRVRRARMSALETEALLGSLARAAGERCLAVAMTGEAEGAAGGFTALAQRGASLFVQDEATSGLFGIGAQIAAVHEKISLEAIAGALTLRIAKSLAA